MEKEDGSEEWKGRAYEKGGRRSKGKGRMKVENEAPMRNSEGRREGGTMKGKCGKENEGGGRLIGKEKGRMEGKRGGKEALGRGEGSRTEGGKVGCREAPKIKRTT